MPLIALTGKMGSGKTTAASMMFNLADKYCGARVVKFADPLYAIQDEVYRVCQLDTYPGLKDRKLLQWIGTDWGRGIDPDLWVKLWSTRVKAIQTVYPDTLIIADDLRFNNEADKVHELGGRVFHVWASRDTRDNRTNTSRSEHESEQGISPKKIDYSIENDGGLVELEKHVKMLLDYV